MAQTQSVKAVVIGNIPFDIPAGAQQDAKITFLDTNKDGIADGRDSTTEAARADAYLSLAGLDAQKNRDLFIGLANAANDVHLVHTLAFCDAATRERSQSLRPGLAPCCVPLSLGHMAIANSAISRVAKKNGWTLDFFQTSIYAGEKRSWSLMEAFGPVRRMQDGALHLFPKYTIPQNNINEATAPLIEMIVSEWNELAVLMSDVGNLNQCAMTMMALAEPREALKSAAETGAKPDAKKKLEIKTESEPMLRNYFLPVLQVEL